MDSLVFDTSALLNFGHRGELTPLLKKLSCEYALYTTPGAEAELTDPIRKQFYSDFLKNYFIVQAVSSVPFDLPTLARLSRTLDLGEISVITLARELKGIAVLDEKAARREAKILDLRFIGTLGLLHQGAQRKWMSDPECLAAVIRLCDAKFAIPRPSLDQTFAQYLAAID